MRAVVIVVVAGVAGCSFSGHLPPGTESDAAIDAYQDPPDGPFDAEVVNPDAQSSAARRLVLTVPQGQVTGTSDDFPVYVDVTEGDIRNRLDAAAVNLSFVAMSGDMLVYLDHEVEGYDAASGHLRAWVRLPQISDAADTVFEVRYGDPAVMHPADAAGVFRNGYVAVWHLEQAPGGAASIVDSLGAASGTPAGGLGAGGSTGGMLGLGVDFDGGTSRIDIANPISGTGPSTISAWVSERTTNDNDAILTLGNSNFHQARFLYSRYGSQGRIGVGLYSDDYTSPDQNIQGAGWTLLHWIYSSDSTELYRDGAHANGPAPHPGSGSANTMGGTGQIGNAPAGFGSNMGLNATLDELRVAVVARDAAWIANEHASQANPTAFVTASGPQMLP